MSLNYNHMMQPGKIRLCYRKVIDAASTRPWEKLVFDDSYQEFLMQSQFFNQEKKYTSFGQILQNVPGADQLHFLVSSAITGYVHQLNGRLPDIVNTLGRQFLSFNHYRFELINSDIKDRSKHQVAINFFTEQLSWHSTIGNHLLVSSNKVNDEGETLTDMFALQPFLSIYSIR